MRESGLIIVRTAIVFLFLLGMPIAALPRVQQTINAFTADSDNSSVARAAQSQPTPLRIGSEFELPPVAHQVDLPVVVDGDASQVLGEKLERLKQELIASGASSMVLDRVGLDGGRYRFTCEVPVAEGSPYRRQYHSVASNPEEAMSKVLAELRQTNVAAGSALPRPTVRLR